jgi:ribosome-binding protein aMBF1 (putative translation factor)
MPMKITGRLFKNGAWWLAEMPILEGLTQGKTRKEALAMAADWIETMAHKAGFKVRVIAVDTDRFVAIANNVDALIALVLRRRREAAGLSLADVAKRMDARSRNAYARYERGQASPSIGKLEELLHAVDPEHDLALSIA